MKLSNSEAGKLGAEKAKPIIEEIHKQFVKSYYENPKCCPHCNNVISFEQRRNKFCSHSCAASYHNPITNQAINTGIGCMVCGNKRKTNAAKYCSRKCQKIDLHKKTLVKFFNGEPLGIGTILRCLKEHYHNTCQECGITEWRGKELSLEQHHIDGNSENRTFSNLSLLCPNCHSQTDTYKSKNKNSMRVGRSKYYNPQK